MPAQAHLCKRQRYLGAHIEHKFTCTYMHHIHRPQLVYTYLLTCAHTNPQLLGTHAHKVPVQYQHNSRHTLIKRHNHDNAIPVLKKHILHLRMYRYIHTMTLARAPLSSGHPLHMCVCVCVCERERVSVSYLHCT